MKPIRLRKNNKYIRISKCRGDLQSCSYCKNKIKKWDVGLLITKPKLYNFNVWIHARCINNFAKDIVELKKKNIKKVLSESLT
ncbi:hypothetical protein LCGC14_2505470 [marine sediment metagenome]|uniref:PARP-type domain-containing protein n=1 Tax=marine sediment metagenome TaxID=412755 RepID=A0A0F9DU82_9ZZZZ